MGTCRKALAEMSFNPCSDHDVDQPALVGAAEQLIAVLWRVELALQPVQRVTPYDSFVELGGDSLHALRVSTALKDLYEAQGLTAADELLPANLMRTSTLRAFASRISEKVASNARAPPRPDGSRSQLPLLTRALANLPAVHNNPSETSDALAETSVLDRALLQSAGLGAFTVVRCLLNLGANPHPHGRRAWAFNALHAAANCGSLSTLTLLLQGRADARSCTGARLTAAHYAARVSVDALKLLTRPDSDGSLLTPLGVQDSRRQTMLHHAARAGNAAAVSYLCERFRRSGPSHTTGFSYIDSIDTMGWAAVHWAVLNGHEDAVLALLAAGAIVVRPAVTRNTRRASACGHRKRAETQADPETPLEIATRVGATKMVLDALQTAVQTQSQEVVSGVSACDRCMLEYGRST